MKLRLNRVEGVFFKEETDTLEPLDVQVDGIVLWASKPFRAKMFSNNVQSWVYVAILTVEQEGIEEGEVATFLLNSGSTNALQPWLNYRQFIEQEMECISQVVTRFSFEPWDNGFYGYKFEPISQFLAFSLAKNWLKNHELTELIDPSIPVFNYLLDEVQKEFLCPV